VPPPPPPSEDDVDMMEVEEVEEAEASPNTITLHIGPNKTGRTSGPKIIFSAPVPHSS